MTFKSKIRKGDTVQIITGNEKGKTGKVLLVMLSKHRAIVEGCCMVTKHTKPTSNEPNGKIEKKEASIHLSNLAIIEDGKPVKIGRKLNEKGILQRYSKKTSKFI